MTEPQLEWLVSVDDHVIEPPNVWLDRLPSKYHDVAPRMVETDAGAVWRYEDAVMPTSGLSVAAGKKHEEFSPDPQMVVSMHVGSSSTTPAISSNAPALAWLFSDYFQRMPGLKIALSEGNIGCMPYFIERAEQVVDRQPHWVTRTETALYNVQTGPSVQADLDRLDVRETFRNHISAASSRRPPACAASTSSGRTTSW